MRSRIVKDKKYLFLLEYHPCIKFRITAARPSSTTLLDCCSLKLLISFAENIGSSSFGWEFGTIKTEKLGVRIGLIISVPF
jgi:hypothetical protein